VSVGSPVTVLHVLELFATAIALVVIFFVLFGGSRSSDSSCHLHSLPVFQSWRYELQCCYRCLCTNRRCDTSMPECFHTARRNAQVNFSNFSRMKRLFMTSCQVGCHRCWKLAGQNESSQELSLHHARPRKGFEHCTSNLQKWILEKETWYQWNQLKSSHESRIAESQTCKCLLTLLGRYQPKRCKPGTQLFLSIAIMSCRVIRSVSKIDDVGSRRSMTPRRWGWYN